MKRIVVQTQVPAGMDLDVARQLARAEAIAQFPFQIVEETLLPVLAHRSEIDPTDGIGIEAGVNDTTVDRVLTTTWALIS